MSTRICLLTQERLAEQFAVNQSNTVREVVVALQDQSSKVTSNSDEYFRLIKNTLSEYECKSMRAKLECLYTVLQHKCPTDAVRLIMNYFMETLPDGCPYSYDDRLLRNSQSTSPITGYMQNAYEPDVFVKERNSRAEKSLPFGALQERNQGNPQGIQQWCFLATIMNLLTIIFWKRYSV
ncbi:unnamed protein product [Dicrocoelium dendriticum]|nr:unnamed protein product [Dicrocoelium dendriticum]